MGPFTEFSPPAGEQSAPAAYQLSARLGSTQLDARFSGPIQATGDAALSAFLLPAMAAGQPLRIESGAPSTTLLENAAELQSIVSTWWPGYRPIEISANETAQPTARASGVGAFFSGGVDSFYTAITRREELTHLIFVKGFDIPIGNVDLWARALEEGQRAAASLGLPLLVVETDLREHVTCNWEHYHGGALATVAHQLSHIIGKVIVPASHTYRELYPWGSHPLTDRLWSGDQLELEHHGADVTRVAKIQYIARHDVALDHLRVCWQNPEGSYNCGRCEKCVRTMISLHLADSLDRCATLPSELDYRLVRTMRLRHASDMSFVEENLDMARAAGDQRVARSVAYARMRSALYNQAPDKARGLLRKLQR